MNHINISENIVRLRHKKKITQEELAAFVGVTKASVSKWETGQSMPDILLLPLLAGYFDVTVDELLGYEPQLSREQIRKLYQELAGDFASLPFEEVMRKSQEMVKTYYSCHSFLFQVGVLWLNHYMMAPEQERQMEVLAMASDLCSHIMEGCKELEICNDAVFLKAAIDLQRQKAQEVVDSIEELLSPVRVANQSDSLLIQAYQMTGDVEKADSFAQISMFLHLLYLVNSAIQYLGIHTGDDKACGDTMERIDGLLELYRLEQLHPNTAANYYYQTAVIYCGQGKQQEALKKLEKFVHTTVNLLKEKGIYLHGDAYFDKIDAWFEQLELGAAPVRDRKVILSGILKALENPVFSVLEPDGELQRLKKILEKEGEKL